jgi:hypothetical protein
MARTDWDGDSTDPQPVAGNAAAEFDAAAEPEAQPMPAASTQPAKAQPAAAQPSKPSEPAQAQPTAANQRRTRRIIVLVGVATALVIASVVVLVAVPGPNSAGNGSQLSAAHALTAATRESQQLQSVSATIAERFSGATTATISGRVTEQRNPLRVSMTIDEQAAASAIPVSAIITGNVWYFKLGGSSLGLPAGLSGKWIKIPLAELGPASVFATLVHNLENENPASQTQLLLAAGHVRDEGTFDVDGVATSKYSGEYNPAAALRLLPASTRAELAPYYKLLNGNVDFSIWIDGQHHIRQLTEIEHLASGTVTVLINFTAFNQPVHITAPPASQTVTPPTSALTGTA